MWARAWRVARQTEVPDIAYDALAAVCVPAAQCNLIESARVYNHRT